jgi:nicotinamidase-related amidase
MNTGEAFDDADYDPYSYGAMIGLFEEGSWNSEFAVEVKPEGSDIVLRNRKNFSAFQGTQLRDILESKGIQRLFIMGFLSNVCIEETTREASDLFPDMNIYVMVDGCAAKSKKVSISLNPIVSLMKFKYI